MLFLGDVLWFEKINYEIIKVTNIITFTDMKLNKFSKILFINSYCTLYIAERMLIGNVDGVMR